MHKQGTVVYEMEMRYTKVSRNTGKEYKVWHFIAMSPIMENLDICKSYRKGKYLMVETADGLIRYNMETEYTVDYGTPEEEENHEQFEEGIEEEIEVEESVIGKSMKVKGLELGGKIVSINESVNTVWFVTSESNDWVPARIDQMEIIEEEIEVEEPSEIVKWLVHNIRTTGEASALCLDEAEEAMAICTELKTKCDYNGQGRFIITVISEPKAFKVFYDASYDSVEICENQSEIVTANTMDEAVHTLIKRLELYQPGVEIFINGGYEMKELTNRVKIDTLKQRLSAIKRAMGMCENITTYKGLGAEYNKVQDQITQLMEGK